MRVRDAELFHAVREGYQLWGALNGVELWVHPDDPEKYRICAERVVEALR